MQTANNEIDNEIEYTIIHQPLAIERHLATWVSPPHPLKTNGWNL